MLPSSSHPLHTHFGRNNNQQPPNPAATTIFSYWSLIYLQPFQTQSANSPYPRRLLIHNPLLHNSARLPALSGSVASKTRLGLDASVVLIMAVLICAIVCAIGLNTIVRCALQCSDRMAFLAYNSTRCDSSGGKKALKLLPSLTYSTSLKTTSTNSECAICLTEFKIGEQVRLLPKCKHSFHVKCIDQWLAAHPSCPNCRQCLSLGCHKSSQGMAGTGALQPLPLPPRSAIRPLHPEGALINYHLQRSILMS